MAETLDYEIESLLDDEQETRLDIEEVDDFKPEFDPEFSSGTDDDGDADDSQPSNSKEDGNEEDDNAIYQFLKERGISDPNKIQFENEDGEIEEYSFNSLDKETQLNMLKELTDPGLSDHEKEVITYLRQNQVTLPQVVDYFAEQRLQEYLAQNPEAKHQQVYTVDDYTDDELYLADMKYKYPGFSDEELVQKLNIAKSEEELYNKEVAALREAYKQAEDRDREYAAQREKQEYEDMRNNLAQAAVNFKEISLDSSDPESDALEIEDSDRREILSYLLDQDKDGKSRFVRDLENPSSLIKLAYYMLKGDETLSGVTQYWKDTLKNDRKEIAKLKKEIEKINNRGQNSYVEPRKNQSGSPKNDIDSFYERLI